MSAHEVDRALVRAAWSLGLAPARVLARLGAPQVGERAACERLRRLVRAGSLQRVRVSGGRGSLFLYGVAAARPPGARAWRPSSAQLDHTLDVGECLVALVAEHDGWVPTGWEGEAEVRAWAGPGSPYPDGLVRVRDARGDGAEVAWWVEVDRATESRAAWRAKLARYLAQPSTTTDLSVVLVVTTGRRRAGGVASVAREMGADLLVTTLAAVRTSTNPLVLPALGEAVVPLAEATRGASKG